MTSWLYLSSLATIYLFLDKLMPILHKCIILTPDFKLNGSCEFEPVLLGLHIIQLKQYQVCPIIHPTGLVLLGGGYRLQAPVYANLVAVYLK